MIVCFLINFSCSLFQGDEQVCFIIKELEKFRIVMYLVNESEKVHQDPEKDETSGSSMHQKIQNTLHAVLDAAHYFYGVSTTSSLGWLGNQNSASQDIGAAKETIGSEFATQPRFSVKL